MNKETLEKKIVELFKEEGINEICVNGNGVIEEIEGSVCNGNELVEIVFYIEHKKYIVYILVDVKHTEIKEDVFKTDIEVLEMWLKNC